MRAKEYDHMASQDQFVKIEIAKRPSNKSNHDLSQLTEQKLPATGLSLLSKPA
jgi:hypothetical protein